MITSNPTGALTDGGANPASLASGSRCQLPHSDRSSPIAQGRCAETVRLTFAAHETAIRAVLGYPRLAAGTILS